MERSVIASPLLIPADGIVPIPLLSWVRPCSTQTQISYPATCQTARRTLHINTVPADSIGPCDFHRILRSTHTSIMSAFRESVLNNLSLFTYNAKKKSEH